MEGHVTKDSEGLQNEEKMVCVCVCARARMQYSCIGCAGQTGELPLND
jgi:hypothetical protein